MIKRINKGFTLVELVIAMLLSSFIMGGLVYVVSEANFYLQRQLYRDSINKYADQVFNDIFAHAINAQLVNIENQNRIVFGYRGSEGLIDSFSQYDLKNKRCWLIQAELPRKTLSLALKKQGAKIISTPVYRTVPSGKDT